MTTMLLVMGRPGVLVPDPELLGRNPPRFIGKRRRGNVKPDAHVLEMYEDAEEIIANVPFVRDAVKRGDLIASDVDTAKACGIELED